MENAIESYKRTEILQKHIKKYRNHIIASDIKLHKFNYTMGVATTLSNDTGYMSTPFFIFSLTTLSSIILNSPNKEESLFNGLQKINMHLPANVYIPFVSASMRNYAILHIKVIESKIFETKSRAPYLICVEVFRPEEADFIQKSDQSDDESNESDGEYKNNPEIELQPKNNAAENWKNFLIKNKDLEQSLDEGIMKSDHPDINNPELNPIRLRSESSDSRSDDKAGEYESRKEKSKKNLFSRLFKKVKKRRDSLIHKIDKFADKKASHFMNLK